MIRKGIAYCPCCVKPLDYHKAEDYFWCECDGWNLLRFSDRQKELERAETCDYRRLQALTENLLKAFRRSNNDY